MFMTLVSSLQNAFMVAAAETIRKNWDRHLLQICGFSAGQIERITYLVGHHHTYNNIDGLDYQILVEADFLVNFYEDATGTDAIRHACETVFKTASGREICRTMFDL